MGMFYQEANSDEQEGVKAAGEVLEEREQGSLGWG